MIQRIQSVYLALAVILLVLCCCMPLATFEPIGMGKPSVMYSLVVINGNGTITSYLPILLFCILVIAEIILVFALLGYKNRRRQMSMCRGAMLAELLWIICYAGILYFCGEEFTPHISIAAFMPLIAFILTFMARRAIKKDDDLVRSAERFR
jgi:hypothetical protein